MKILLISPNYMEDAWMVSAVKTAEFLAKEHDVMVLTTNVGNYPKEETKNGVKIRRMKTFFINDPVNLAIPVGQSFALNKVLKQFKPDRIIINKHMFYTALLAFNLKLKGYDYYLQTDTFPGKTWFNKSKAMNVALKLIHNTVGKKILKLAKKVIILHENIVPACKEMELNYQVIHNGVNYDKYANAEACEEVKQIKGDKPLITYVGRLDDVKGYNDLFRIAITLPRYHFLFIAGNKHKELRDKLNKFKNITCLDFRDNVEQYLKATDLYVLPSYAEGLPNTLMEAMASGCICAARNVGGVSCLLNKKTGYLFTTNKELESIIKGDFQKNNIMIGKNAQDRIKKHFNLEIIRDEWNELLK